MFVPMFVRCRFDYPMDRLFLFLGRSARPSRPQARRAVAFPLAQRQSRAFTGQARAQAARSRKEHRRAMMSGKETAVVSRRGAGANAADLMEVRARDARGCSHTMQAFA